MTLKNCRNVNKLARKIESKGLPKEVYLNIIINDSFPSIDARVCIMSEYSALVSNTDDSSVYLCKKLEENKNPWGIFMPNKNRGDDALYNNEAKNNLKQLIQELEENKLKIINADIPEFLK